MDEIEEAGMIPMLVNAGKAKAQLGARNKTDHLDAKGLNVLQRTGTLPTVWIPPAQLRDRRELYRTRMFMKRQSIRLKNRILATLAKYALSDINVTDRFRKRWRVEMGKRIAQLPTNARYVVHELLIQLDEHDRCVHDLELQMEPVHCADPRVDLLDSLPGVGRILAIVISYEIGVVDRFPSSGHLAEAAYCMLKRNEAYREPQPARPRAGERVPVMS